MMKYRNGLLAGIAAIALVAGTGFASAQGTGTGQGSQAGTAGQHMQSGGAMGHSAQSGETKQSKHGAKSAEQGEHQLGGQAQKMERGNKTAQGEHREGGKSAKEQRELGGKTAQGEHMKGKASSTAQREEHRGGAVTEGQAQGQVRGGATAERGTNVRLTEQQRTQIRDTVIKVRGAPKVGHVNFNVRVGTVIPRGRIHVVPVPETLVRIEPQWRGFLYFIYEHKVVIVNPGNMKIVAVVPA